jgi:thioredoxin-related protein
MVNNFSQRRIVDKTRRHFVAIALNIWGDRETTWLDGRTMSEKNLARALDVQFTPTLLFFDENGKIAARLNGYYPPEKFEQVLDYVSGRHEKRETLAAYMARRAPAAASATLADEPFFAKPPYTLTRSPGSKPLAVVFETPHCSACDELHRDILHRPDIRVQLGHFDVARFALGARTDVTTPDGAKVKADAWAHDLRIGYTPTIVFYDAGGREVFRLDAYQRAFHFASALDYVASGAYRSEPSFQRFVQARAERLRSEGTRVDLWE